MKYPQLTAQQHQIWDDLCCLDGSEFAKYCIIIVQCMQDYDTFRKLFPDEQNIMKDKCSANPNQIVSIDNKILKNKMVFISFDDDNQKGSSLVQKRENLPFVSCLRHVIDSEVCKIHFSSDGVYSDKIESKFNICKEEQDDAYWFQQGLVQDDVGYFCAQFMSTCELHKCRSFTVFYHAAIVFMRDNFAVLNELYNERFPK